MAKALADEGYAEKVTVRQAVKRRKIARARNCQLTVSGCDLFDVETSTPEQLSADPSEEDRTALWHLCAEVCRWQDDKGWGYFCNLRIRVSGFHKAVAR